MKIVIPATVKALELKKERISSNLDKTTGNVMEITVDLGWFVTFHGSHESLFVGKEKPTDMDPGNPAVIVVLTGREAKTP